jgi:predicted MFS family arabinose efflux permease
MGLAAAPIVDRFDRRLVVLIGLIGLILGTLACALAPGYLSLIAARALAGACGGLLNSQILAIVGDVIPFERRGRAMGMVMSSFSIASVMGVPFGLWLANLMNWHLPFLALSAVTLAALVLARFWLPELSGHLGQSRPRLKVVGLVQSVLNSPNERQALAFMGLLSMSQFLVVPFVSPAMVANVGLREDQLPLIYFFGGLFTVFSSPLVGMLSDKISKTTVFTFFAFLNMIPCFLISVLTPVPLWLALTVTTAFFVCSNGRFVPATSLITAAVTSERRGGFMSLVSTVQSLAAGLATGLAGLIVTKGPSGELQNFVWAGVLSLGLGFFAIAVGRRLRAVQ